MKTSFKIYMAEKSFLYLEFYSLTLQVYRFSNITKLSMHLCLNLSSDLHILNSSKTSLGIDMAGLEYTFTNILINRNVSTSPQLVSCKMPQAPQECWNAYSGSITMVSIPGIDSISDETFTLLRSDFIIINWINGVGL